MRKAIVTGAAGFIGSWLAEELLYNDIETTVVVRDAGRLLKGIAENPGCRVVEKDIGRLDRTDLEDGYDVFFHLAWEGVAPENRNRIDAQIGNIPRALRCMELCSEIGCRKFIASGTVAEYALCDNVMDFGKRQSPNDIYGATKAAVHNYLDVRSRQLGQDYNWVIIPSTFGERRVDNNIITYTIRTLAAGGRPVYGELNQMWDFLYVGEVARALRLVGEKGIPGKTYGIGSGEYRPLREYIEQIRDLIDPGLELGIGESPDMTKRTFSSCVNIYDLKKDTGFAPRTSFEEGIRRTIEDLESRCRRGTEGINR